jgi:hypothetical protein
MQKRQWLKPGQHFTKCFDRLCFAASDWGKLQTTYLFSDFAINNVALYNSLFTVEAIFQRDMQIITKEVE